MTLVADTQALIELDLTDPNFSKLAKESGRIAALLRLPVVQGEVRIVGCLDDLLGAVYCLVFATITKFGDRHGPIERDKVLIRAEAVSRGSVRTDGKWMAGFHLNSAMYRLSATYDRILKTVTDVSGDLAAMRNAAEKQFNWKSKNIRGIHGQVTALKHDRRGAHDGRRRDAGLENAYGAVGELLSLTEAWACKKGC